MFEECNCLENINEIFIWNTKNVINMQNMFYNCSSLIMFPINYNWDISNVINISFMFLIDVIEAEGKQLEARMFPDSDMKVNAPVLYIIENGKVLNYIDGTASSTEIVEFLKNNGIINN